jgi:hypothetical protein
VAAERTIVMSRSFIAFSKSNDWFNAALCT